METVYKAKTQTQMSRFFIFSIAGITMLVMGLAVSEFVAMVEPSIAAEYENINIFRPWSDPLMSFYWIMPFLTAFVLLWLWNFTKSLIKGDTILKRGITFGFYYWIITIPGMIITYTTFQVSVYMVVSWTAATLVQALCAGIIFSRLQP
jgi:hypothetical protein